MTEEHDTAEDVSRNANAEDEGIEVAEKDILCGEESLQGDDVVGVVPWKKDVSVTIPFAVTVIGLNVHD